MFEAYANEQWQAGHATEDQAAELTLERFAKLVRQ